MEVRYAEHEFREDAAHGPHVYRTSVILGSKKKLRGAVPPRDGLMRHGSIGTTELPIIRVRVRVRIQGWIRWGV